ncbi:hypothetical protein H5410_015922, partial [Solanum commersonii]
MTTLIPVSCWNVGIRVDKINWGLYFLTLKRTFHGCCTFLDASLASTRSFNSALTFELGVLSRNKDEIKMTSAGTAAPPKLTLQPQPAEILLVRKLTILAIKIPK